MTTPETTPLSLSSGHRVAIVAGSGRLPIGVAQSLQEAGHAPFVIAVSGEAGPPADIERFEHLWVRLENVGDLRGILKRHKITHLVLAGGIGRRPNLKSYRLSLGLLAFLPRLARGLVRGDDALLKLLIEHVEAAGTRVVGAHEIIPDIVAIEGPMAGLEPLKDDWRDLDAARLAALTIGRLDIGQAAISINGRVIALEGIEGTDGLLARARELRSHGRIAGWKRGVLVKFAKPQQELRADLPVIGPSTIDAAHEAGLAGIGIEAGRSLVLDWGVTMARADELGLFVVGLRHEPSP